MPLLQASAERAHWDDYMQAFAQAIYATNTKWALWYIIPADHKWVTRALVPRIVTRMLNSLNLNYPAVWEAQRAIIAHAKEQLEAEKG